MAFGKFVEPLFVVIIIEEHWYSIIKNKYLFFVHVPWHRAPKTLGLS